MSQKVKISVIIPTFNVEKIIEKAIRSVNWADEILVVDSFSSDGTVALAKKMGAKVIQHEYVYSAKQKNWAIPQAKNEWILLLDSDEEVTCELKESLEKLLENQKNLANFDGFGIARQHYFFGKFLFWGGRYPLYNVRFFRKKCRYEDRDVHAHIILNKERMGYLKGDILHYSDRDIVQFMEKFNRYSTYQANYMEKVAQKGIEIDWKKFLTNHLYFKSIIKDLWCFIPGTPIARFLYMYVLKMGFLDGKHGLIIALFYGLQDYVSRTKYLEKNKKQIKIRIRFQKMMIRELCYRVA